MKKTLLLITSVISINLCAQTAKDYFNKGKSKAEATKLNVYNYNKPMSEKAIAENKEAVENFDKAIELDPKYAEAYYWRGISLGKLMDAAGSEQDYKKAIEVDPKYAEPYLALGSIKNSSGDTKAACDYFKKAAELGNKTAKKCLKAYGCK